MVEGVYGGESISYGATKELNRELLFKEKSSSSSVNTKVPSSFHQMISCLMNSMSF